MDFFNVFILSFLYSCKHLAFTTSCVNKLIACLQGNPFHLFWVIHLKNEFASSAVKHYFLFTLFFYPYVFIQQFLTQKWLLLWSLLLSFSESFSIQSLLFGLHVVRTGSCGCITCLYNHVIVSLCALFIS